MLFVKMWLIFGRNCMYSLCVKVLEKGMKNNSKKSVLLSFLFINKTYSLFIHKTLRSIYTISTQLYFLNIYLLSRAFYTQSTHTTITTNYK